MLIVSRFILNLLLKLLLERVLLGLRIIENRIGIDDILTQRLSLARVVAHYRLWNTCTLSIITSLHLRHLCLLTILDIPQLQNVLLRIKSRPALLRGCSCSKLALYAVICWIICSLRTVKQPQQVSFDTSSGSTECVPNDPSGRPKARNLLTSSIIFVLFEKSLIRVGCSTSAKAILRGCLTVSNLEVLYLDLKLRSPLLILNLLSPET